MPPLILAFDAASVSPAPAGDDSLLQDLLQSDLMKRRPVLRGEGRGTAAVFCGRRVGGEQRGPDRAGTNRLAGARSSPNECYSGYAKAGRPRWPALGATVCSADARLPCHRDAVAGRAQPPESFQQAAEPLPAGHLQEQTQGDGAVHDHMRGQSPGSSARSAGLPLQGRRARPDDRGPRPAAVVPQGGRGRKWSKPGP